MALKIWPENSCLLSLLKDELIRKHRGHLGEVLIILPTQRLATCLIGMLARELQACVPPEICTWETFLKDHVPDKREGTGARSVVSESTFELLLGACIRTGSYRHLDLSHAHELKQLYNDITEHGLGEDCLLTLQEVLREDVYREEKHIAHLSERLDEIHHLFTGLRQLFQKHRLETGLEFLKEKSGHISDAETLKNSRGVYLACFTTVKACFRTSWQWLASLEHAGLWFTEAPEVLARTSPLAELLKSLTTASLPAMKKHRRNHTGAVSVHSCATGVEEVAKAMELAEAYVNEGCPPSQIALLLTNEGRYGKLLRTFLQEQGVEANMAIATPLSQTLAGSWLSSLMEWFESTPDNCRKTCLAFLQHRISSSWLLGFQQQGEETQQARETLNKLIMEGVSRGRLPDSPDALTDLCSDRSLGEALARLRDLLQPLWSVRNGPAGQTARAGMYEWATGLETLLGGIGMWSLQEGIDEGVTQSSLQALAGLMDSLLETGLIVSPGLSESEFFMLLKEKMQGLETRSIGYPLKGLQVLGLTEARFIPFQVVIILGCNEGQFPKALPSDFLLDDWQKNRLGLPGWQYIEALEDTTFQLLQARIPVLELLYSRELGNVPAVRSRFIEKLLYSRENLKALPVTDQVFKKVFSSSAHLQRKADFSGRVRETGLCFTDPLAPMQRVSAGSLESLLHCPYRFAMDQTGLKRLVPEESPPHVKEGLLLHKIFEIFFRGGHAGRADYEPLPTRIPAGKWRELAGDRLASVTREVFPPDAALLPLRTHLLEFSWPALIEEMAGLFAADDGSDCLQLPAHRLCEWPLGRNQGVVLRTRDIFPDAETETEIGIRGVIDRFDSNRGRWSVTDYKRKTLPSAAEIAAGLKPQLPLYALALSRDPLIRGGVSPAQTDLYYWSILEGTVTHVGSSGEMAGTKSGKKTPETTDLVSGMLGRWQERFVDLVDQRKSFMPEPGAACRFCNWEGVCRKSEPGMKNILRQKMSETDVEG